MAYSHLSEQEDKRVEILFHLSVVFAMKWQNFWFEL